MGEMRKMKAQRNPGLEEVFELNGLVSEFLKDVKQKAGESLSRCLHCSTCAGGCPFSGDMDPKPNGVIRMIQLGLRKEAFECPAIWICVGCYTCTVQCPMGIDIPGVMDAVRQLAVTESADIAEPDIFNFHKEVIRSVERYGRTHKLGIMMRYKMKTKDWFTDFTTGARMFLKRKLELIPSRVKDPNAIRRLF